MWVDDGIVCVVGGSLANVKSVIASISEQLTSAAGVISVPTDQIGLFKGSETDGNPSLRYITLLRDEARAHDLPEQGISFLEAVRHA